MKLLNPIKRHNICRTSIYDARNNFSNLVALAESGEPVELTRYNKPVAVIISYKEYEHNIKSDPLSWLKKWREKYADVLDDEGKRKNVAHLSRTA